MTEQGEFLALDLGGSNFRILLVKVKGNGDQKVEMESQIYDIPELVMRGSGSEVSPSLPLPHMLSRKEDLFIFLSLTSSFLSCFWLFCLSCLLSSALLLMLGLHVFLHDDNWLLL